MRRILLAGVCLFALSLHRATAQIHVLDDSALVQAVKSYAVEYGAYLKQAQQYATQLQQYATEVEQLNAFVHDPSLGAAMGLMNQAGLASSLPINPMTIQGLATGFGGMTSLNSLIGKLGQLNGLVNSSYTGNHIYSPTDGSYASQQLNANGTSLAGTQGSALSVYQDLQNHLPIIQALRDRLLTATTPKDVADAQAQLQAETVWTNNVQSQLAAINVDARTQQEWRAQRDNEAMDKGIDNWLAQANASGRGLLQ